MSSNFDSFVNLNKKRHVHRSNGEAKKNSLFDDSGSSSSSSDEEYNEDVNRIDIKQRHPGDDFAERKSSRRSSLPNSLGNAARINSSLLDENADDSERERFERNSASLNLTEQRSFLDSTPALHSRGRDLNTPVKIIENIKDDNHHNRNTRSSKVKPETAEQELSPPARKHSVSGPLIGDKARNWSPSKRSSSVSRKKFRNQLTLPTLDETSDEICNTGLLDSQKKRAQSMGAMDFFGKLFGSEGVGSNPLLPSSRRKLTQKPKKPTRLQKVRELQAIASDLAQRGDEEEAIKVYRRALQVAGTEVSKINSQINKQQEKQLFQSKFSSGIGSPLPVAAIKSIQNRIQEDLMTMSERIGRIRLVMAVLYERVGDYENAIKCCTEAIDVYKHQQLLKVDNNTDTVDSDVLDLNCGTVSENENANNSQQIPTASNSKTTKERLKDSSTVLQRLRLARDLFERRKKSIDEMTRIRNEINVIDSNITKDPGGSASAKKRREEVYANLYEVALQQLKRESSALGKSHPQIVDVLLLLSSLAEERILMNEALQYLSNSLKIYLAAFGRKHHKTAHIYIKIARLHRAMHQQQTPEPTNGGLDHEDLTLQNFVVAIEVLRHSKLRPTLLGSTLNDVAIICMKRRQFTNAIDYLKEALQRYEENTEALTTSVAHDLIAPQTESDAGSGTSKLSSDQETEETSSNSSFEDEDKVDNDSKVTSPHRNYHGNLSIEALQVWRNLGECYYQVHQYDDAKDAFANALEIQRSTRTIHDAVSELDLGIVGVEEGMLQLVDDSSIIDTLSRLGKTCLAGKRHQDAYMAHMECLELMNHLAVEEELYDNLRYDQILMRKQVLVKTLYCIANSCTELSKYDDALRYYSESIQHSRIASAFLSHQSVSKISANRQQQKLQDSAHCVLCFVGIGDVHLKQEKYPEALKTYNDALKYSEMKGKLPLKSLSVLFFLHF